MKSFFRPHHLEGFRIALPFVIFYAILLIVPQLQKCNAEKSASRQQANTDPVNVILQGKDPQHNRIRRIQLKNSYINVLYAKKVLGKAQNHETQMQSVGDQQHITALKTQLHDALINYNIVADESEDSVFTETHLPKSLPVD